MDFDAETLTQDIISMCINAMAPLCLIETNSKCLLINMYVSIVGVLIVPHRSKPLFIVRQFTFVGLLSSLISRGTCGMKASYIISYNFMALHLIIITPSRSGFCIWLDLKALLHLQWLVDLKFGGMSHFENATEVNHSVNRREDEDPKSAQESISSTIQ